MKFFRRKIHIRDVIAYLRSDPELSQSPAVESLEFYAIYGRQKKVSVDEFRKLVDKARSMLETQREIDAMKKEAKA